MGEQEAERALYRERVAGLEEELQGREWHQGEVGDYSCSFFLLLPLQVLGKVRELQKELAGSRGSWARRLAGVEVRGRGRNGQEQEQEFSKTPKREEEGTTVKKLISTILPHSEELQELPQTLAPDCHLVSEGDDEATPRLVVESKPSTLIALLLSRYTPVPLCTCSSRGMMSPILGIKARSSPNSVTPFY